MKLILWLVFLPALSKADDEEAEIRSLHVISDIRFRFAKTVVISRAVNPSTQYKKIVFHLRLPSTAFITNFTIFSKLEKRARTGTIYERESAKQRFQILTASRETTGYVGLKNVHETNTFQFVLNVRPADKVTFNLTYEEVLQRQHGLYKHDIYIDPGQPVPDMKIDVAVRESRDITTLEVPLTKDVDISKGDSSIVLVQRPSSKSAYIRFHPTLDQQLARWAEGTSGHFTVMYDVDRGFDAGDILISNGYFIHFFAPAVPDPVPKDVLFILDTSTSMFRGKLDQVKAAMKVILEDLNPDDRFNIISFGSRVQFWQDKMAEVKQTTNVQRALEYLDKLEALGWTNMKASIGQGVEFLNNHSRSAEGSLIIFLTDGHATAGETNSKSILQHVRTANGGDIPIYPLAFGKDADWDLMRTLAVQNSGIAKRIYTDGNATRQIEDFYNMVAKTMLESVIFYYSAAVSNSTQTYFTQYAEGSEIIVTGQLDAGKNLDSSSTKVTAVSSSGGVSLKPSSLVVDLKAEFQNLTSLYDEYNIERMTKRMWAYLYIKEILKKRLGETDLTKREKLEQEALKISLEHKLVTPVTSMVVDTPYDTVDTLSDYREAVDDLLYHKEETLTTPAPPYYGTRYYWGSRRGGGGWDPHFMVYMNGLTYPICFDVKGEDGQMYQILRDPQTDLTMNARMARGKMNDRAYYMTEIVILFHDLHLHVTSDEISVQDVSYSWNKSYNGTLPGGRFFVKYISPRLRRVSVVFDSRLQIDITNHVHRSRHLGQDFLNIELGNEELLSRETDGILGQFIHKKMRLENITFKNGHLVGHLESRTGLEVEHGRAQIVYREDPIWRTKSSCWLIKKMGARLFDGPADFYMISDMFQTTLK